MKRFLTGALLLISVISFSQNADTAKYEKWKSYYRASATRVNDLVNTKLEVRFDFSKSWMYGKEWVTLHPHFYPTDTLTLDAKKMSILEVAVVKGKKNIPLKYTYDSMKLHITLDKTYRGGENYTLYINYISKPNDMKNGGSAAITGDKGLYFINPLGKEKDKPTEIWTQGETESNSVWVPTIDKPDQKTTDEIIMTVPDKYVTLSNGLLIKSKKHKDGTRTDTWLMDLPHAPYLMMMAAGEYSIIKDKYEGKDVAYYVEKEYAPVARKIFGLTPEMIAYYARITGVDFPWQKYDQIVVRDYVSGAMENTTATVHASFAQQDARQLVDGNSWEDVIAHELFHQWFGDYVTTESWSNLTLNESFADLSETLWETYKHGKDAGDEHNYNAMRQYLASGSANKDLVRFYYKNREDMFDLVSYQKGGRILNMLRNYVGDSAFYKTLNLYLNTYKFGTAEAHELRLAFEQVTGQDMNWFFNEWYFGSGHPVLDIKYGYDEAAHKATVVVKQKQSEKVFRMPVAVDVYQGGGKKRYKVWIDHRVDSFSFPVTTRPDLINFDGDKILLCVKTENKTLDNYIFQYKNAGLYLDRREAIEFAAKNQTKDPEAFNFLKSALNDRYWGLRRLAIGNLNMNNDSITRVLEPLLKNIAENDPKTLVQATAIEALGDLGKKQYTALFLKAVDDSSYTVAGKALIALGKVDSVAALRKAHEFSGEKTRGELSTDITLTLFKYSGDSDFDELASRFENAPFGSGKFSLLQPFAELLIRTTNPDHFKKGIDMIADFRDSIPENIRSRVSGFINGMILGRIINMKQAAGLTDQADYVKSKIPSAKSKSASFNPMVNLAKYTGEYDIQGTAVKIVLRDNKLFLVIEGQPDMELAPESRDKFSIRYMDGYSVQFTTGDNGEVTEFLFATPNGKVTAKKIK